MELRYIGLALAVWALPALADSPPARFIAQERSRGIPVVGFSGSNWANDPGQIQYDDSVVVSPDQRSKAESDAAYFNWSPLPDPDYQSYQRDCLMDASLDTDHLQFALLLANPILSADDRSILWKRVTLDDQYSKIQSYASMRHLP